MNGSFVAGTTEKFGIGAKINTVRKKNKRIRLAYDNKSLWYKEHMFYQYKVAGSDPRLSSTKRVRFIVSQTRMRVPLSDAVATKVPCEFKAKQATSP